MLLPLSGRKEWYFALSKFIFWHCLDGQNLMLSYLCMYPQEVNGNAIKKGKKRPLVEERLVYSLASAAMIAAGG
jgi:hypothetical protein